jgi:hypothetical protein
MKKQVSVFMFYSILVLYRLTYTICKKQVSVFTGEKIVWTHSKSSGQLNIKRLERVQDPPINFYVDDTKPNKGAMIPMPTPALPDANSKLLLASKHQEWVCAIVVRSHIQS